MPLVVYKSSAGSGKTTTLVNEYLNIGLRKPTDFKHILAITFTNKAAREMKERIIFTLKKIDQDQWNGDSRIRALFEKTQLDEVTFAERARELLTLITHRYEDFSVSTIDSFVHKIIRTFANEVSLPPNFEVVIQNDDLIPDIIANLYDKVGKDEILTEILVRFVIRQSENEKSPDPGFMLGSFIKNQMDEESFLEVKKLETNSTPELWNTIKRILETYDKQRDEIEKLANRALDLIAEKGISPADFAGGKSGIFSFFNKAALVRSRPATDLPPTATVLKYLQNNQWHSAKSEASARAAIDQITDNLVDIFVQINQIFGSYFQYYLISQKIYILALIFELRQLFTAHTAETGKVHISEFNKLVYNQVADQPVPYIYERLGKKFHHFLIDEFQDTSILQWNNLLPLIDESLAYSRFNMLVGDAKQAIYRFRNGEVELFSNLPKLYGSDNSPLSVQREHQLAQAFQEIPLDQNWRSHPEIIEFNNEFFAFLKSKHTEFVQKIYGEHRQQTPKSGKTDGLIDIEFAEGENKEKLLQNKQEKILRMVEELLQNNYQPGDIGILCRTKEAVQAHAAFLMEKGYAVLSEESLLVANAPEVQAMAAFFQLIVNPSNTIAQTALLENFRTLNVPDADADTYYRSFLSRKHTNITSILSFFGPENTNENLEQQPLTEIADFVLREILKVEEASVFVQYYFEFLQQAPQLIDDMNRLWEEKKGNYFIATPENTDAIQVMTVHKSKGLAFEVTVVDADTSQVKNTRTSYWDESGLPESDNLKVALFPLSKALSLINRQWVAEKESERSALDYLNILYVAFTRPIKALFVLANKTQDNKFGILGQWLIVFLQQKEVFEENKTQYTFGKLPFREKSTPTPNEEYVLKKWPSFSWKEHITVAKPEESAGATLFAKTERDYGSLVHMLLAQIGTASDIDLMLKKQVLMGTLTEEEAAVLGSGMWQIVCHPKLETYYKEGVKYKNETEILLDTKKIIRPDRVVKTDDHLAVIDYKTGEIDPKHEKQIVDYRNAFQSMGYTRVEALLVYLRDEVTVVEVS